jgi:hypothetical protein
MSCLSGIVSDLIRFFQLNFRVVCRGVSGKDFLFIVKQGTYLYVVFILIMVDYTLSS